MGYLDREPLFADLLARAQRLSDTSPADRKAAAERLARDFPPHADPPGDVEAQARMALASAYAAAGDHWQALRVLGPVRPHEQDFGRPQWVVAVNSASWRLSVGDPGGALSDAAVAVRRMGSGGDDPDYQAAATWSVISRIWSNCGLFASASQAAALADRSASSANSVSLSHHLLNASADALTAAGRSSRAEQADLHSRAVALLDRLAKQPEALEASATYPTFIRLAITFLAAKSPKVAVELLLILRKVHPLGVDDPHCKIVDGLLLYGQGRLDDARAVLSGVLRTAKLADHLRTLLQMMVAVSHSDNSSQGARADRKKEIVQRASTWTDQTCALIEYEQDVQSARSVLDDVALVASLRARPQGDATVVAGELAQLLVKHEAQFSGISLDQASVIGRLSSIGDIYIKAHVLFDVELADAVDGLRDRYGRELLTAAASSDPIASNALAAYKSGTPENALCRRVRSMTTRLFRSKDEELVDAVAASLVDDLHVATIPANLLHAALASPSPTDPRLPSAALAHMALQSCLAAATTQSIFASPA